MKKGKNRISTFSSPKEYVLPKVVSSENIGNKFKGRSRFPYLFKFLEDSHSISREKMGFISEEISDCADKIKENNVKVRKRTRND